MGSPTGHVVRTIVDILLKLLLVSSVLGLPDKCQLPALTGNCRAKIPRWFYNVDAQRCERFFYGGCNGNDNRFNTYEDCMQTCQPEACLEPAETGPCRASFSLFHYDISQDACRRFVYGGCGGNANRFMSASTCEKACKNFNASCATTSRYQSVRTDTIDYEQAADQQTFFYQCEDRCQSWCSEEHTWGPCLSLTVDRTWYGVCTCHLFDHHLHARPRRYNDYRQVAQGSPDDYPPLSGRAGAQQTDLDTAGARTATGQTWIRLCRP